jgi:hypothetical protein
MKKIITLFYVMVLLVTSVSAQEKKQTLTCKGTSKSGVACKSTIVAKNTGYCNAHNPNRTKCTGKNSKNEPCGMVVQKGKTTCRFHGV